MPYVLHYMHSEFIQISLIIHNKINLESVSLYSIKKILEVKIP